MIQFIIIAISGIVAMLSVREHLYRHLQRDPPEHRRQRRRRQSSNDESSSFMRFPDPIQINSNQSLPFVVWPSGGRLEYLRIPYMELVTRCCS